MATAKKSTAKKPAATARAAKTDATVLLQRDHADVKKLFKQYEKLADAEADDRRDAEPAQRLKTPVGPRPVGAGRAVGRGRLPQHGVAERPDAERREAVEVAIALGVTAAVELGEVVVPDPVDGAFDAAPHLEGGGTITFEHRCSG